MSEQLLRDPAVEPSDENIKNAIGGDVFDVFNEFRTATIALGLNREWNYYNDGKAWLCKVVCKKKTVVWLSIWDGFFRIGFYFTDKTRDGLMNLDIADKIKHDFTNAKAVGKLLPLVLDISEKEQLGDLLKVVEYKKNLK